MQICLSVNNYLQLITIKTWHIWNISNNLQKSCYKNAKRDEKPISAPAVACVSPLLGIYIKHFENKIEFIGCNYHMTSRLRV